MVEIKNIENKKCEIEEVDFDTFLSTAGKFGRYQWFLFFSTFPFYVYGAFVYFGQIFLTESSPNHWCWVPELENLTDMERRSLAIPPDLNSRFGYSHCEMFLADWDDVLRSGLKPNNSWSTVPCQNGWEFNKTEMPYDTIASEMGWVCDKSSNQATAQSIFFVGSIFGGLIFGWISDQFGRLPAATCANMVACIAGIASTFTSSFSAFTVCRFFVGMGYDNCMIMTYLLVLEYVAPRYRTFIANLPFAIFYTLGLVLLPWIALACGHWKTLGLAISIPLVLSLLAPFVMPESPRWLLSKGRVNDTINKVLKIGQINRKPIPKKIVEQFRASAEKVKTQEETNLLQMLKRPLLRKMFVAICLEYMCIMIAFDVSVRSVGELKFDFFLSFTLVSLTEFPSLVIISFILDLTGRRWLTIVTMLLACVFCLLTAFIADGLMSVICAVVARFVLNMATNTGMQWVAEILPTSVRGSGSAIIHICGFIATTISPFIAYLKVIKPWLPLTVTSVLAALSVVLAFLLPETAQKDLPQVFEDSEQMIKNQPFWDFPCNRKHNDVVGHVNNVFEMTE